MFVDSHAKKYIKTVIEKIKDKKNKNNPLDGNIVFFSDEIAIEYNNIKIYLLLFDFFNETCNKNKKQFFFKIIIILENIDLNYYALF